MRTARARFSGTTSFLGVTLAGIARFRSAVFEGEVSFNDARFGGHALFNGAEFGGQAGFHEAVFGRTAQFNGVRFGGPANFAEAAFGPAPLLDVNLAGALVREIVVPGSSWPAAWVAAEPDGEPAEWAPLVRREPPARSEEGEG